MAKIVHSIPAQIQPVPNMDRQTSRPAIVDDSKCVLHDALALGRELCAVGELSYPTQPAHSSNDVVHRSTTHHCGQVQLRCAVFAAALPVNDLDVPHAAPTLDPHAEA